MLTEVLDSNPTADISFPSHVTFNVIPTYKSKIRGQAILGQRQGKYSHFTPVRGPTEHVKQVLEVPDTDTSTPEALQPDKELLKAEKIAKGEEEKTTSSQITDSKFEAEAKEYLETPEVSQKEIYGKTSDPVTATIKRDKEIANVIAAATLPRKPRKSKKQTSIVKKKSPPKTKKMVSFRILSKRK